MENTDERNRIRQTNDEPQSAVARHSSLPSRRNTVRQTIVETLEAPRLTGIEVRDFVLFKERRIIYERQISEKSAEQGSPIPKTSLRNSIDPNVLKMFIRANLVPDTDVESISEASIEKCICERATIQFDRYDLAAIERIIEKLRMDPKLSSLESQVWKLALDYEKILTAAGYNEFISKNTSLAVQHIMSRITHDALRKRAVLTYRMKKDTYKSNYNLFLQELASDAQALDKMEGLKKIGKDVVSDSSIFSELPSMLRPKLGIQKEKETEHKGRKRPREDDTEQRRGKKRVPPDCLNPKCPEKHYMDQCKKTTDTEKKTSSR